MRWTVAGLTPCSRAIDRTLQCVAFFGVVRKVISIRAASFSGAISLGRPERGRSYGKRPVFLSITHKLSTQEKPEFDVCEP